MNGILISGAVSYSMCSVIAYSVAGIIFYLEAKRKDYPFETIFYIVFGSLFGALLGSRIGSAIFVYRDYYSQHLTDIFLPQLGGKTLIGGLIGGYLGVVISKKILKFRRSTGDLFAPGLAIGIAIGRIGCILNGCCYGVKTNLPWGMQFSGTLRHPTQLYESVFSLVLFVYLWRVRKGIKKEGDLFKAFLFFYSFFRFWIEFLRGDKVIFILGLSIAQAISTTIFIMCALYFLKTNKEKIR